MNEFTTLLLMGLSSINFVFAWKFIQGSKCYPKLVSFNVCSVSMLTKKALEIGAIKG